MQPRATFIFALLIVSTTFSPARPAYADSVELAGDILQYGIPAIALGMTGYRRDLPGVGYLTASVLVTETWVWTLKVIVDDERPSGGGRGFPSGHAATAAVGAGFMHRRYGFLYAVPLYLGTGFVAWSRYDARAHRPLDVVAGVAIGIGTSMALTVPWQPNLVVSPMALRHGFGALVAMRF